MQTIMIHAQPFPGTRLDEVLQSHSISVNDYARQFFAHPTFVPDDYPPAVCAVLLSLRELGLADGATLGEIYARLPAFGLKPCLPTTGLFLRLAWREQPESENLVLSGTHRSPEGAVTVFSKPLEDDDRFPKGLYLRKVGGVLWLRGYICDESYRWSADDVFAFEQ